jgi:hypothetical protein
MTRTPLIWVGCFRGRRVRLVFCLLLDSVETRFIDLITFFVFMVTPKKATPLWSMVSKQRENMSKVIFNLTLILQSVSTLWVVVLCTRQSRDIRNEERDA